MLPQFDMRPHSHADRPWWTSEEVGGDGLYWTSSTVWTRVDGWQVRSNGYAHYVTHETLNIEHDETFSTANEAIAWVDSEQIMVVPDPVAGQVWGLLYGPRDWWEATIASVRHKGDEVTTWIDFGERRAEVKDWPVTHDGAVLVLLRGPGAPWAPPGFDPKDYR